jgi:hypothetical protein
VGPEIPSNLQNALLLALDAERESQRALPPSPATLAYREQLLQVAKETLYAWREDRLTTSEAVEVLEKAMAAARPSN